MVSPDTEAPAILVTSDGLTWNSLHVNNCWNKLPHFSRQNRLVHAQLMVPMLYPGHPANGVYPALLVLLLFGRMASVNDQTKGARAVRPWLSVLSADVWCYFLRFRLLLLSWYNPASIPAFLAASNAATAAGEATSRMRLSTLSAPCLSIIATSPTSSD